MKCSAARTAWHERMDGGLDAAGQAELAAHLLGCADCIRFAEQMKRLEAGFGGLRNESESAADGAARSAPWRRLSSRAFRGVAQFAIAAAVLLAAGIGLYFSRPPGRGGAVVQHDEVAPPRGGGGQVPDVASATRVQLVGASADDFLLLSEKSTDARVHIYRLHAVYRVSEEGAATSPALVAADSGSADAGS